MAKICAISDTHTYHDQLKIESVDILLHAGDYSFDGRINEVKSFLEWFSKQPARYKIFIDGNHDGLSEKQPSLFKEILKEYSGVTYLKHEGIEIEGIKIWGRPTTPTFGDWYHMADRGSPKMLKSLEIIPTGTHILLTHGPAAGILDITLSGESVGCHDLAEEIPVIEPKVVVFGHIHQSSGMKEVNGVTYVNAAVLDDYYKLTFKPKVFDFSLKK